MIPRLIFDAQAALGEGAIWHAREQLLYWVDILGKKFWRTDPATDQHEAFDVGQMVGTIVPRRPGGMLLALHHGLATYDCSTKQLRMICDPEDGQPALRFNDGKCDPAGRFWAGTMPVEGSARVGSLFCLHPDGRCDRMLTGVGCSNGIVWSRDARTMYYIDTVRQTVDAFDFDLTTGQIANRRVAITVPSTMGYPDGATLDSEGMLWIAHWGGSCVTRWNPHTNDLLATIKLPTSNITSCAFGGPNLDRLYITSAGNDLKQSEPLAGAVFCVDTGVTGIPAWEFAG